MEALHWISANRRGSLQLDSEPQDGTKGGRRGSVVSIKLPLITSPRPVVREEGSKVLFPERKEAMVEPRTLPPNSQLLAARRGSFSSTGSDDQSNPSTFNFKPSKGVKHFYVSNPSSPVPSALQIPKSKGFGEVAANFAKASKSVVRRMSTGCMEQTEEKVGVLGVLAEKLGISGSQHGLAEKVYTVMIHPVPQAQSPPLHPETPADPEAGTLLDPMHYPSSSRSDLKVKLKHHCQWIRKGEQGFLQGKKTSHW